MILLFRVFKTLSIPNSKGNELTFWESAPTTCRMSGVTCQMSGVRCHVADVTCKVSKKIFLVYLFICFWTSCWACCYQRGQVRQCQEGVKQVSYNVWKVSDCVRIFFQHMTLGRWHLTNWHVTWDAWQVGKVNLISKFQLIAGLTTNDFLDCFNVDWVWSHHF